MKILQSFLLAALSLPTTAREMHAYFGETHMHTAFSLDAYIGGCRLAPHDSYRFAKGEDVFINGVVHNIGRPLDFAAVTDHAEYLGEMYSTMYEDGAGHNSELLKQLRGLTGIEERQKWFLKYVVNNNRGDNPKHPEFYAGPETTKSGWKIAIDAAREHNDPGVFTAFAAYEWSSAPGGGNLHRNIIFRDLNVPDLPMSAYEIPREEALWKWLDGLEKEGMKPLAIPHNSNASKGLMFPETDSTGKAIDAEYAKLRAHFEPLIEMMQVKGNSEVHRKFWPADEFADFENADSLAKYSGRKIEKRNFVRYGLVRGLKYEQDLGTNPFRLGFIGGTDSHNGVTADVAEQDYVGSHGPEDGSVERRFTAGVGGWIDGRDLNPGSLAGVWAEENSRAAIWDAMMRRETFTTSGPRMKVRLFGGPDLPEKPMDAKSLISDGYGKGQPMGSTLKSIKTAPNFFFHAIKDVEGANLDRVQIIKGWVTKDGEMKERIYDVAVSGDREIDKDGRCLTAVGNTVDVKTAKFQNTIGSAELIGGWTDPDFDPAQHALYYLRAIEIPTPRWTTYNAVEYGVAPPKDAPTTIQERAWSSPIWVTP